jgi:hypothetical protein
MIVEKSETACPGRDVKGQFEACRLEEKRELGEK